MSLNFLSLVPSLEAPLESLAEIPLIKSLNDTVWIFAVIETGHLLFLALLGGATLVFNLRLLNLILPELTIQQVERATRPWYRIGVSGTLLTGLSMGVTTARTLLPSGAFFVKMIALVAAILLSGAVARLVRRGHDIPSRPVKGIALGALLLWLSSLFLFATTSSLAAGSILVAFAGLALLAVIAPGERRIVVLAFAILLPFSWLLWSSISVVAALVAGALAVTATSAGFREYKGQAATRLAGAASILAWVTVAAAGRWMGFS